MTRDIEQIKQGLAQIRAALNLMEKFIGEYESRMVNIDPREDVKFYRASDEEIISGAGIGELESMNQAIHETARAMAAAKP